MLHSSLTPVLSSILLYTEPRYFTNAIINNNWPNVRLFIDMGMTYLVLRFVDKSIKPIKVALQSFTSQLETLFY